MKLLSNSWLTVESVYLFPLLSTAICHSFGLSLLSFSTLFTDRTKWSNDVLFKRFEWKKFQLNDLWLTLVRT